jgi:D-arginine dehydrogenase
MNEYDTVVIGGGMAGASIAALLADHQTVAILEAEDNPGYHATGRSAAFWTESYGGPLVQPLTSASGPFLANPPPNYSAQSFLKKRGALYLGTRAHQVQADQMIADFRDSDVPMQVLNSAQVQQKLPCVLPEWDRAIWEPSCADIDVAALHSAYLRVAKNAGAKLICRARVEHAVWRDYRWQITTSNGRYTSKTLVNAAGAWADQAAIVCGIKPIGITAFRRSIVQLSMSQKTPDDLPLVIGLDGSFYFKPAASGQIWLSPHDETPSPACDTAPEELDIAMAIERLGQVMDWHVKSIEAKWAGLRSFAPDRLPVIGRDKSNPNFFWFAGQGGFGIQTAPAAAELAVSLLVDGLVAPNGINADTYAPMRF